RNFDGTSSCVQRSVPPQDGQTKQPTPTTSCREHSLSKSPTSGPDQIPRPLSPETRLPALDTINEVTNRPQATLDFIAERLLDRNFDGTSSCVQRSVPPQDSQTEQPTPTTSCSDQSLSKSPTSCPDQIPRPLPPETRLPALDTIDEVTNRPQATFDFIAERVKALFSAPSNLGCKTVLCQRKTPCPGFGDRPRRQISVHNSESNGSGPGKSLIVSSPLPQSVCLQAHQSPTFSASPKREAAIGVEMSVGRTVGLSKGLHSIAPSSDVHLRRASIDKPEGSAKKKVGRPPGTFKSLRPPPEPTARQLRSSPVGGGLPACGSPSPQLQPPTSSSAKRPRGRRPGTFIAPRPAIGQLCGHSSAEGQQGLHCAPSSLSSSALSGDGTSPSLPANPSSAGLRRVGLTRLGLRRKGIPSALLNLPRIKAAALEPKVVAEE
uniref:GTSE1_N domain-containing protein n=1 Tax=Mesocestoides corti TaxID=53468 RepID=A0A5K3F8X5_MESCO